MPGHGDSHDDNGTTSSNVLSFGCELEFLVAYVKDDEPDPPDAHDENLAPILRIQSPKDRNARFTSDGMLIYDHIRNTLRKAGLIIKDDLSWQAPSNSSQDENQGPQGTFPLPLPSDIHPERVQSMFGISVKDDGTVGDVSDSCNGCHLKAVELTTSASWTSPVAFQELEVIIDILRHTYRLRVNRLCGLQFHVGNGPRPLSFQTVKRTAALLWCLDPIICHIHPPQRRHGNYSTSMREQSALAHDRHVANFYLANRLGLGREAPVARPIPARHRRFPDDRLPTCRPSAETQAELEAEYADGLDDRGLDRLAPSDVHVTAVDGARQLLACSDIRVLKNYLRPSGGFKPNYSFAEYDRDDCAGHTGGDWEHGFPASSKLTIEFREAVGSLDAKWVCAWGRICAGIVLFAQNASATDFFSMIMRLAQAQGEFDGPDAPAYDIIDFLDDIGCFSEAELLEIKMQDRMQFWYPCQKLAPLDAYENSPSPPPPRRSESSGGHPGLEQRPPERSTGGKSPWSSEGLPAPGVEPTTTEKTDQAASDVYHKRFPHGRELLQVSGDGLLCGPRAVIRSMVAQEGELLGITLQTAPTVQELVDLQEPWHYDEDAGTIVQKREKNNFLADQLGGMLGNWGRQQEPRRNLRLGVETPSDKRLYHGKEDEDPITIWIWNDGRQDEAVGVYGHYQGLQPLGANDGGAINEAPGVTGVAEDEGMDADMPFDKWSSDESEEL